MGVTDTRLFTVGQLHCVCNMHAWVPSKMLVHVQSSIAIHNGEVHSSPGVNLAVWMLATTLPIAISVGNERE